MKFIGLSGRAASGKTESALALSRLPGTRVLSFALPMKMMMRELCRAVGMDADVIDAYMTTRKETPIPEFGGLTMRRLLQTLGTEWGRSFDEGFWIRVAENHIRSLPVSVGLVVFDDVRFLNERDFIEWLGGRVFRVERETLGEAVAAHVSETALGEFSFDEDSIIRNNGTKHDLSERVFGLAGAMGVTIVR